MLISSKDGLLSPDFKEAYMLILCVVQMTTVLTWRGGGELYLESPCFLSFPIPHPHPHPHTPYISLVGGGGYWNHSVRLEFCPCV